MPREPRYLSVVDAAAYIGRTPQAVYHLVHKREIPFIKRGKRVAFDVAALDRWMHRGAVAPRRRSVA